MTAKASASNARDAGTTNGWQLLAARCNRPGQKARCPPIRNREAFTTSQPPTGYRTSRSTNPTNDGSYRERSPYWRPTAQDRDDPTKRSRRRRLTDDQNAHR
eukprot:5930216-Alexandrium_andersonii.AAC.1